MNRNVLRENVLAIECNWIYVLRKINSACLKSTRKIIRKMKTCTKLYSICVYLLLF